MSDKALIAKFLGTEASEGGPFGLLGIRALDATPARIEQALQVRLDAVDEHAEAYTPAADEVRLALHAAAAQVLDPRVRKELMRQAQGPLPLEDSEYLPASLAEERAPVVNVAESPVVSRQRADESAAHVRVRDARYDGGSWQSSRYAKDGGSEHLGGTRGLLLAAAGLVGVIAVAMTLIVVVPTRSGTSTGGVASTTAAKSPVASGSTDAADQAKATNDARKPGVDSPARSVTNARVMFVEPGVVIRGLRRLGETARRDPAKAALEFESTCVPLADWWCQYDLAQRRAAIDAAVEVYFLLASDQTAAGRVAGVLKQWGGATSKGVADREPKPASVEGESDAPLWRSAFAMGLLTRLGGERDLPRAGAAEVSDALNGLLGAGRSADSTTFESGAAGALRAGVMGLVKPERGASSVSAALARLRVSDYVTAARAVSHDEPVGVERILVNAVERLLIDGPEPDQDQGSHSVISGLVGAIKWRARPEGEGRKRLLDWFRDPRVSMSDLHVVSVALTSVSAAEGVDSSMALSIGATSDDRVRVRALIAKAWGMGDSETRARAISELQAVVTNLSSVGSREAIAGRTPAQVLAIAAKAARANEAARLIWFGDADAALSYLSATDQFVEAAARAMAPSSGQSVLPSLMPQPGTGKLSTTGTGTGGSGAIAGLSDGEDGAWAERYLQAERNIPVRLEILGQLATIRRPIGATDGAVLVEQAMFGTPSQVRLTAQLWAKRFASDAAVIQGVLEQLPTMPRVPGLGELVEAAAGARLPKVSHPGWEIAARRELVARLLAAVAESTDEAGIDRLAGVVADAMNGSNAVAFRAGDTPTRALGGVRSQWERWHAEALAIVGTSKTPLTLGDVERRRASRLAVASGPVQTFAAEDLSLAELMAIVIAGERVEANANVGSILSDLTEGNRACRHVFEQVLVCEIARARLWIVRLNTGGTP